MSIVNLKIALKNFRERYSEHLAETKEKLDKLENRVSKVEETQNEFKLNFEKIKGHLYNIDINVKELKKPWITENWYKILIAVGVGAEMINFFYKSVINH